jgi:hypothetical protein
MKISPPSWLKLPLVLSLLLLVPRVGLAAQDAPLADPEQAEQAPDSEEIPSASSDENIPGTDERAPLRLMDEPPPRVRHQAPLPLRILAEAAAGTVTSIAGGLAGGLLGLGFCAATTCGGDLGLGYLVAMVLGGTLGAGVGYPLGVWWGGEATGGDGKLLMSMAGLGVGILVGGLVGAATLKADPDGRAAGLVGSVFTLAGPIIFYELSNRDPGSHQPAMALSRPRIQPLLSVSTHGAQLGLGGTF